MAASELPVMNGQKPLPTHRSASISIDAYTAVYA